MLFNNSYQYLYVSKFLLNNSRISEYGIYSSMLKWWLKNWDYPIVLVSVPSFGALFTAVHIVVY